jgi:hypothetical protein
MILSLSSWKKFLETWNDNIFFKSSDSDLEYYKRCHPEEFSRLDCLKPPATEVEIQVLEKKLGKVLPPSYRNFLLSSNGLIWMDGDCELLFGTHEIDWLSTLQKELVDCWCEDNYEEEVSDKEYFHYRGLQSPSKIRKRYLRTALQISNYEDGYVYLLNPMIVDERGEWESWAFGTKILGAYRYPSFGDMMQQFYQVLE